MRFILPLLAFFLPLVASAAPLRVFVSVLPMQTFVEKVGGKHVEVHAMVQPGFSPATYDPTPQQIAKLAQAQLYVRTGVPFEHAWMQRIRSANPAMEILDARAGLELLEFDEHHGHHEEAVREEDPHVWTSPRMARQIASSIRDKLSSLAPEHRESFQRNHAAFIAELDALDSEIHALLDPLKQRRFLVFHPSWGYFAHAYGLEQVAIEYEGKQPGARTLASLIEKAKRENIRVIFIQPQFDRRQAQQVAEAIGGSVIAVDPLAADYIANLRKTAQAFAGALQP